MNRMSFQQRRNMNTSNNANIEQAERLIKAKPWSALTSKERQQLHGLVNSEAEYSSMREHLLTVEAAMQADLPELEPDAAVLKRLQNTMALKPKQPQVHKQSMFAGILSLFSMKALGLKTSLAAFVLVAGMWFGQAAGEGETWTPADSVSTRYVDSAEVEGTDTTMHMPMLFIAH